MRKLLRIQWVALGERHACGCYISSGAVQTSATLRDELLDSPASSSLPLMPMACAIVFALVAIGVEGPNSRSPTYWAIGDRLAGGRG